jgi:hypothetical protein
MPVAAGKNGTGTTSTCQLLRESFILAAYSATSAVFIEKKDEARPQDIPEKCNTMASQKGNFSIVNLAAVIFISCYSMCICQASSTK